MTLLINTIPTTSTYKTTTSLLTDSKVGETTVKNEKKVSQKKDTIDNRVESISVAGGVAATLLYMTALAKSIKKKDFKVTDILNINYDARTHFKGLAIPFRVIGLATSALVGGMVAGVIVDKKENIKPKLKEGVHQFLGNIITPITIVGTLTHIINEKHYPTTKAQVLSGLSCIAGVCGGVVGGNLIATAVNNKLFNEHDERKIHLKDFGIHVDDLLSMAAMSQAFSRWVSPVIGWALPAIFQMCAYEAGTKNVDSKD